MGFLKRVLTHLEALGVRGDAAVAALEAAGQDVRVALSALGRRHQLPELVRLRRQRLLMMWRCVWGSIQSRNYITKLS